jgi:hypothetical protein
MFPKWEQVQSTLKSVQHLDARRMSRGVRPWGRNGAPYGVISGENPSPRLKLHWLVKLQWLAKRVIACVRAAPGRFVRRRCGAIQNNVQTNTYDPRRPGATPSLLSCRVKPATSFLPMYGQAFAVAARPHRPGSEFVPALERFWEIPCREFRFA